MLEFSYTVPYLLSTVQKFIYYFISKIADENIVKNNMQRGLIRPN